MTNWLFRLCGGGRAKASATIPSPALRLSPAAGLHIGSGGEMRLGLSREPYWLDFPGLELRLFVRPQTQAVIEVARAKAMAAIRELKDHIAAVQESGGAVAGLPDLSDDASARGLAEFEYLVALAQASVIAWEHVLDRDGGPASVSDGAVRQLMEVPAVGGLFRLLYERPLVAARAEGNASGPVPNGTSAAGPNIADGAAPSAPPAPLAGTA